MKIIRSRQLFCMKKHTGCASIPCRLPLELRLFILASHSQMSLLKRLLSEKNTILCHKIPSSSVYINVNETES